MPGIWFIGRVLVVLVTIFICGVAHTNAQTEAHAASAASKTETQGAKVASRNEAELAATKADLEKMKVLLNQMQVNLGFVQTSQSPLKHQFELETEMWGVLINQMERHVETMESGEKARK